MDGPGGLRMLEAFLNTIDERTFRRHGTPHATGDQLTSPSALAGWLAGQGLLRKGAAISDDDLATAVLLRTTLRQVLLAGPTGIESVLDAFPLRLVPDRAGTMRLAASGTSALNPIVETVATAVVQGSWARVKICPAPDCHWAFYDTSRSGAGRWCSTEVCGNRAKTRAYRLRHRENP